MDKYERTFKFQRRIRKRIKIQPIYSVSPGYGSHTITLLNLARHKHTYKQGNKQCLFILWCYVYLSRASLSTVMAWLPYPNTSIYFNLEFLKCFKQLLVVAVRNITIRLLCQLYPVNVEISSIKLSVWIRYSTQMVLLKLIMTFIVSTEIRWQKLLVLYFT